MSTPAQRSAATDEALDDLDVPAEEADAVSGGITFNAPEDDDQAPQAQIQSL